MIRSYAVEKIQEFSSCKKEKAKWINEIIGTDRYIAIWLIRAFNLRDNRALQIVENILQAYGIDTSDVHEQSKKAKQYWADYHRNAKFLNHVTIKLAKLLADKVEQQGLDPFLQALPVDAFEPVLPITAA